MIDVVGIGLDGLGGLSIAVQNIIDRATLIVGSDRHLSYVADLAIEKLVLGDLQVTIDRLRQRLDRDSERIVVLVSGDPLFFGLGRLLLAELPPDKLTFHPHLSSIQLAFSRVKIPWQDAKLISIHGRSIDELRDALQRGVSKIAILTDPNNSPQSIAKLYLSLDLPTNYQFWICENLGGDREKIHCFSAQSVLEADDFASLNVVILIRQAPPDREPINLDDLSKLGIPDATFLSFEDRPGLMTKREVRVQILGELALQPGQIIWDIGAGTGAVSIEVARLVNDGTIYAIEQTAAGTNLIQRNCDRFGVKNVRVIYGKAPQNLTDLPAPDRVFIGGSGGNLEDILTICQQRLRSRGLVVIALATLEHLSTAITWLDRHHWQAQYLQVQLSRSHPIANLTRLTPLNPVTLITARPH
jgi:precorrin-6Y C5,15-methyltransferase (decarboxylating)